MSPRLATVFGASQFSLAEKKMGRQAASGGLLQALMATEPDGNFRILLPPGEEAQPAEAALAAVRPELRLLSQPLLQQSPPVETDLVFISDPLLGRLAHWRQWQGAGARAYGLIGITHTLCSLPVLEGLRDLACAPVQPWDALICTSHCSRNAAKLALAWEEERLRRRFSSPQLRLPRPRLPLIPLGCDVERLGGLRAQRAAARQALRVRDDQVVALYVGRLAIHAKAHPTVLLESLARLAARQPEGTPPVRLVIYGTAPPAQQAAWRQGIQALIRGFELQLLNGEDESLADVVWAAADLFVSLADNHQETFGLTVVEAMAAGLPVIASDWNGYRDTVRHEETGLLIPTRQPGDGLIAELARYGLHQLDYDGYVCRLMQEVAVDGDALLVALEQLVGNQALRLQMGAAGQEKARKHYSWPVIGRRIRQLADSLEVARRQSEGFGEWDWPLPPPELQFGSWATTSFTATTCFGGEPEEARRRWRRLAPLAWHQFPPGMGAEPNLCEWLLQHLEQTGPFTLEDLAQEAGTIRMAELRHAAHWLTKLGVLKVADA